MQKVSEAIILAGGKGKRMRTVTQDRIPKSLTIIQNRPILYWELDWLAREGVTHAILATGHLSEEIEKDVGVEYQSKFGKIDISISLEKEKLGSGGAVKLASSKISSDRAYIINGDILCNSSLEPMQKIHSVENANATMFLTKMRSPYGVVLSSQNKITEFKEKPLLDVYIHGGIDIIEVEQFNRFPNKGQMEDTIFIDFVNENAFASYKAPESNFWMSIDSEKDFDTANNDWPGI